jgi:hypothetical protein
MQHWTETATEVLRETISRASQTCDSALHEATVNVIDALLSEGEQLPADLRIYHLVMQELYGKDGRATVSANNRELGSPWA